MVITSTYSRAIVHLTIPVIPIHVHFWLYELLFSLDPVFDFAIYVMQVCLIIHTYLELHI
jgi:hypothetical protein